MCCKIVAYYIVISHKLPNVCGNIVSVRTIQCKLDEGEWDVHKTLNHVAWPVLCPAHHTQNLKFAHNYRYWGEEWARVLFTGESSFCQRLPDGREHVWRWPGEWSANVAWLLKFSLVAVVSQCGLGYHPTYARSRNDSKCFLNCWHIDPKILSSSHGTLHPFYWRGLSSNAREFLVERCTRCMTVFNKRNAR